LQQSLKPHPSWSTWLWAAVIFVSTLAAVFVVGTTFQGKPIQQIFISPVLISPPGAKFDPQGRNLTTQG
jgi:hypothetical protein